MKIINFAAFLIILCLSLSACTFSDTTNPANPSYRLVTTQILEIDSALGVRGGLAALTRTSTTPSVPPAMLHGSSLDLESLKSAEKVELNWALIGRRVSTIEKAWRDIRTELDRRANEVIVQSWSEGYTEYFQIMAARHYFDTSLMAVKLDVSDKQEGRIETSVALLTEAYVQTKAVLNSAVIDYRRVTLVLGGFVLLLVGLTVVTSLIARRRDHRFVRQPTLDNTIQPPDSSERMYHRDKDI